MHCVCQTFLLKMEKVAPQPMHPVTVLSSIHIPKETCSCSSLSACCQRVTFCLWKCEAAKLCVSDTFCVCLCMCTRQQECLETIAVNIWRQKANMTSCSECCNYSIHSVVVFCLSSCITTTAFHQSNAILIHLLPLNWSYAPEWNRHIPWRVATATLVHNKKQIPSYNVKWKIKPDNPASNEKLCCFEWCRPSNAQVIFLKPLKTKKKKN